MAETTNAHTEVPGKPDHPPFPPFNTHTFASQLFWLVISFVVLYLLMAKIGLPRIGQILTARRARIDGDIAEAERHRVESEAAMAAYEKALSDARNRAQTIAATTREQLLGEAEHRRKELEAKLNAELATAEQTIGATKAAAMANVREVATEAAGVIVERLVGTQASAPTLAAAVDRALKG
jgi:F-type H+-transporting ATPase subunit b